MFPIFLILAALFLELWKRYSAEITHRWDLTGFDVYEGTIKKTSIVFLNFNQLIILKFPKTKNIQDHNIWQDWRT